MIPLFDLHCDTLLKLYKNKSCIEENNLHISYKKAKSFSPYVQVGAIWSDSTLSDVDAYFQYNNAIKYLSDQNIHFATKASLLQDKSFILAIEDARILSNDIYILDKLYSDGVRILGLNWSGENSLGGAWNTSSRLSPFGFEVVKKCCSLGIIIDISHSNEATSLDAIDLCENHGGCVLASHSNSYEIFNHYRNISDNLFVRLKNINSVVGISLATIHLGKSSVGISQILRHIEHFLNLDGENNVCLGCDFDGVDSLPLEINSISDLTLLYENICFAFGNTIAKKIFFENAFKFISKSLT